MKNIQEIKEWLNKIKDLTDKLIPLCKENINNNEFVVFMNTKNLLAEEINKLGRINMSYWLDYLLLKFGWIKYADFKTPKVKKLYEKYLEKHEKNVIYEIIDAMDWIIIEDFNSIFLNKQEAKKYIKEYK